MSESPKAASVAASGSAKRIMPVTIYDRARSYIEHEDELVNFRTTWMLTINGFLFAALGVTLPKLIEEAARMPAANVGEVRIYFLFVVSLCLVGFIVSLAAHLALNAAYVATAAIKDICDKTYASDKMAVRGQIYEVFHTDEGVLPMVTRGGAQTNGGSSFIVRYGLSYLLMALWLAFGVLAAFQLP